MSSPRTDDHMRKGNVTELVAGYAACIVVAVLPYAHSVALRNVAIATGWLALLAGWRSIQPPRIDAKWIGLFAIWAGLGLLSLKWAVDPAYSINEVKNEALHSFLVFILFYCVSTRMWMRRFRAALFATTALSLVGAVGWKLFYPPDSTALFFNGPGMYSTFLVGVYPFALVLLWTGRAPLKDRGLGAAIVMAVLVGGIITLNRMFWLVIGVQTVLVISLVSGKVSLNRQMLWKRLVWATTVIALVGGALYVVSSSRVTIDPSIPPGVADAALADPRSKIWRYSIERIVEHPVVGAGFGRGSLGKDFRERFGGPLFWHAHNLVLNYGIAMGIPGMVLIIGIFVLMAIALARVMRSADDDLSPYAVAAVVFVIGLFVKNMTDDFFYRQTTLFFWAICGMMLGTHARIRRDEEGGQNRKALRADRRERSEADLRERGRGTTNR